jgi:hypothetical protein
VLKDAKLHFGERLAKFREELARNNSDMVDHQIESEMAKSLSLLP